MEGLMQQVDRLTEQCGAQTLRQIERGVMLETLDERWKEHLAAIDHLRQGIHFRGYAQKNPAQEFKKEAYALFEDMLNRIKSGTVSTLLCIEVKPPENPQSQGNYQISFSD